MKQNLTAAAAILVSWFLLDGLGHGLILSSLQASTPQIWRPREDFKIGVIYTGVAFSVAAFVTIYSKLISPKCVRRGIEYGTCFGIASGCPIAFGGYGVHPIPLALAFGWFVVALVEGFVAGLIVG